MVIQRLDEREEKKKRRIPIERILIFSVILIAAFAFLYYFYPRTIRTFSDQVLRVKNTFCYYVLKEKPHFYYLEMEKNGKNIRVAANEMLELTYRDEFVVKSVVSDDLLGKYTTVIVEGLSKGDNDIGVLLRGVDLVNKIMKSGSMPQDSTAITDYKIRVNYQNEMIATVGLKIEIMPQDWLRFAKDSGNIKEQIEYLKKAIALNKQDIGVRQILAGIYLRQGRLDDAISQYKDILEIKPDDTTALAELAKCYIKKDEFDRAIEVSKKMVKISPQEAEVYISLGLALAGKGLWDKAIENYREAVRLEPENYPLRFKLGEAYTKKKMTSLAIEQYKYVAEHSKEKEKDAALIALGDVYLNSKNMIRPLSIIRKLSKINPIRPPRTPILLRLMPAAVKGRKNWKL